jgi:uncharacterized protein
MAGFRDASAYTATAGLQLLPLRFGQLRPDRYLVNNFVGDGLLLTRHELDRIVALDLSPGDGLYERAYEKLLISAKGQQSQLQLLAMRLRSRMAFLQQPTALHIFVVTLRCEVTVRRGPPCVEGSVEGGLEAPVQVTVLAPVQETVR